MIVGIDPSLTGTAVCALKWDDLSICHLETFTNSRTGLDRIIWLVGKLNSALKTIQREVDPVEKEFLEIYLEGYAYCARGASVISLGELGGLYRVMLAQKWGGYYEVPPTSMKKFVCGKGNANKNVVLEQCYRKFTKGSDTLKNDNEVDAYCLARFGVAHKRLLQGLAVPAGEAKIVQAVKEKVWL